jgi:hypothetical protein
VKKGKVRWRGHPERSIPLLKQQHRRQLIWKRKPQHLVTDAGQTFKKTNLIAVGGVIIRR